MSSKSRLRAEALVYHAKPTPGKIKIVPTKPYATQRDLALAYSPGVAEPCLEIEKDVDQVYRYTNKGNLVAVITNGTAVLGLGDIGPEASKPVMEGKSLLFKIFADLDSIDIELDTKDVDQFVETVKTIAPSFGGINLEDIKAPEAFEIERRLKEELDIPVMHDDQHGTAIISAAALLNALELAGKTISEVKIVINGAGAAAVSCTKLYKAFGAKDENIVMCDSKGVIRKDRTDLSEQKAEFATSRAINTLEEAMIDADVFVGLSIADVVDATMLQSMAADPIVFALANPTPEVDYNLAIKTRDDIIMATGRSDHPNQVNNVLGFPYIFRGALDVRATKINEEMKMAAVKAIADLAKESVPEEVNITYQETRLTFGRDYIIPKPFDPRLIERIPPAVAKAAIESGVAKATIDDWDKYTQELYMRSGSENKLVRQIHNRAKSNPKRIVFAEGEQLDIIKSAQIVYEEGIAFPILLGRKHIIEELMAELEFDAPIKIIDPKDDASEQMRQDYGMRYWNGRKRTGITEHLAKSRMRERTYFGAMMVKTGDADGMLSGYSRSFSSVVKPYLEIIGVSEGYNRVASANILITDRGPIFLADTTMNIDPSTECLTDIALMTKSMVEAFGFESIMAMLSYSNFGSSLHPNADKVKKAVRYLHDHYPEMIVDGELQLDFALNKELHQKIFPFSKLAGKRVNTLVFPNLESANITYKLLKEVNKSDSIGPFLMGINNPVHVLQLGSSVSEIVNMTAITVLDAQERSKKKTL